MRPLLRRAGRPRGKGRLRSREGEGAEVDPGRLPASPKAPDYSPPVTDSGDQREGSERAQRRAARKTIAAYHEEQLGLLLGQVRDGFVRLDAGEIDAFELDELIHRYKQAARELWKFCNLNGGGPVSALHALEFQREHGDEPDWWEAGQRRRRR